MVVVLSPMMARVHRCFPHSGETMMIDGTSSLDTCDVHFFSAKTPTPQGAQTLFQFISDAKDQRSLTYALEIVKKVSNYIANIQPENCGFFKFTPFLLFVFASCSRLLARRRSMEGVPLVLST